MEVIKLVRKAVDIAISKATTTGIAVVGASGYASATGALGFWAKDIAQKGFVGIVLSQCPGMIVNILIYLMMFAHCWMILAEMVAPHGSYEPIFGTNPIAFGITTVAPADLPSIAAATTQGKPRPTDSANGSSSSKSASDMSNPLVLDMATSAFAWFGVKTALENGEKIPGGVAYDSSGDNTDDPAAALGGALRSFDRSYKGSHLGLMVELLAGAFTGASMSDKKTNKSWGTMVQ